MKYLKLIRYLWHYRQNYKKCVKEIEALTPLGQTESLLDLALVMSKHRDREEEINDKIRKLNISWLK